VSDADQLRRLGIGFQVSQAIHVAARLGIADLLAGGARTSDELAEETGTHADSLYRLLRALATVGVLHEEPGRRFALTPLGEPLRSDAEGSLAGWARFMGRPYFWEAWTALEHSVRTGENAFRAVHGTDVWSYRSEHPEESALFDGAMAALTGAANRAVLAAYDFSRFGTLADIGGGNGTLLAAILSANPGMRGILFDQPHVVAGATGVLAPVADRCTVVSGSFFESVPAGADAYLLKWIIHDWEDPEATAILSTCRAALDGGTILVIERVVGPPNEDPATAFGDLNMLVAPGGRERTLDEFERLFADAGLALAGSTPTASGSHVIQATAA
jgi:hypothetical protein